MVILWLFRMVLLQLVYKLTIFLLSLRLQVILREHDDVVAAAAVHPSEYERCLCHLGTVAEYCFCSVIIILTFYVLLTRCLHDFTIITISVIIQ